MEDQVGKAEVAELGATSRRPFAGALEVAVVLPREEAALGQEGARALAGFRALLREEAAELALELGAPPRFVEIDPALARASSSARPRRIQTSAAIALGAMIAPVSG